MVFAAVESFMDELVGRGVLYHRVSFRYRMHHSEINIESRFGGDKIQVEELKEIEGMLQ